MTWTEHSLEALLAQLRHFGDDTTEVECKRAAGGMPESLGATLSAFANMPSGGTIILGVDEQSGFTITGIGNPSDIEKKVAHLCRQSVQPSPQLKFSHLKVQGKQVVVITVLPLLPSLKPALYGGKAYLRQADGDYAMNPNDLRLIGISALHDSERVEHDLEIITGTSTADLDAEALKHFLQNIRRDSRRLAAVEDDARLLQLTNVTDSQGQVRLAGLYALGFFPQSSYPALGSTAAVQLARTTSGQRTSNLVHLDGPLPDLVEQCLEWIERNADTVATYTAEGHLVDQLEFPMTAIREIIANAFVHRDLGPTLEVGKRVEIRLTPRALIIVSPGGLRGVTVEQLLSTELAKAPVNQRLYEISKHVRTTAGNRVIEGEGGGIREAIAACAEAGLPQPRFIDNGVQFKVIFPRARASTAPAPANVEQASPSIPTGRNTGHVIASLQSFPQRQASFRQLQSDTQLSEDQLRYALKQLLSAHTIAMIGGQGSRDTVYSLLHD